MTDDIVTRLRDYLAIVDHAFVLNELSDAADEIERLQKNLAQMTFMRNQWRTIAIQLGATDFEKINPTPPDKSEESQTQK